MNNKTIIGIMIGGIVIAAAAFYAGSHYQSTKTPQFSRREGMMRTSFRPVAGEIIDADTATITVKTNDGSTKIVVISDKTVVTEATEAAKTTLVKSKKVAVFGTENSDGTVTAQSIQLNPQNRLMGQPKQ